MEKRISSRGIIINGNQVLTMFRRKIQEDGTFKEYYVVPGGGLEKNESLYENVIREIKEEFNVDVKVLGYLGNNEDNESIAHFFHCEIIKGIPTLSGEELERFSENNYYEIRTISIKKIKEFNIIGKEMIIKAFNKEYTSLED